MTKLGELELGLIPRVAVGFSDNISAQDLVEAKQAGLDVAEVRIDLFKDFDTEHVINKLTLFKCLPTIATIRTKSEGGQWDGSETDRAALFEAILPYVDAVDVELSSTETLEVIVPLVKEHSKKLVISYHDFEQTKGLADLLEVVKRAKSKGADFVKIATHVESQVDVQALAGVLLECKDTDLIVIGMGSKGFCTRTMFPALGSLITFASFGELQTAPGQIGYKRMMEFLRTQYSEYNEDKIQSLQLIECA